MPLGASMLHESMHCAECGVPLPEALPPLGQQLEREVICEACGFTMPAGALRLEGVATPSMLLDVVARRAEGSPPPNFQRPGSHVRWLVSEGWVRVDLWPNVAVNIGMRGLAHATPLVPNWIHGDELQSVRAEPLRDGSGFMLRFDAIKVGHAKKIGWHRKFVHLVSGAGGPDRLGAVEQAQALGDRVAETVWEISKGASGDPCLGGVCLRGRLQAEPPLGPPSMTVSGCLVLGPLAVLAVVVPVCFLTVALGAKPGSFEMVATLVAGALLTLLFAWPCWRLWRRRRPRAGEVVRVEWRADADGVHVVEHVQLAPHEPAQPRSRDIAASEIDEVVVERQSGRRRVALRSRSQGELAFLLPDTLPGTGDEAGRDALLAAIHGTGGGHGR